MPREPSALERIFPIFMWLRDYRLGDLPGDGVAGLIVAIMLVPQAMAYAMLAGLPPQTGLYASILPLVAYGLLGSSRTLAVGPVAIVSLMTASAIGDAAAQGYGDPLSIALVLAVLSGAMLLATGIARAGVLANFLSHPVISGFTSAAAIIIAMSQLKHLIGVDLGASKRVTDLVPALIREAPHIQWVPIFVGGFAIGVLVLWRHGLPWLLKRTGVGEASIAVISKTGPLAVVVLGVLLVNLFALDGGAGLAIVGVIPGGPPPLTLPVWDFGLWRALLPYAGFIALVGFLESVAVARSLASKRRQHIDANQELMGLGAANIVAAFSGGYPVTGGFSRSVVNFSAGANTPLASFITAVLVLVTVMFFTPALHDLPKAVLAAIIIVAVVSLIDVGMFVSAWRYNKADAVSLAVTFFVVLFFGIEQGILSGVVLSLALFLWRTSQPHMAVVGRVGTSEHFRNVLRHEVQTLPHILSVRVDASLYFANARYLEDQVLAMCAVRPQVRHVVLICSAVDFIDASALETLEALIRELYDAGITLHLAEVKGPVTDALARTKFREHLEPGQIFLSTHNAVKALT